jgi:hypothetical protein
MERGSTADTKEQIVTMDQFRNVAGWFGPEVRSGSKD